MYTDEPIIYDTPPHYYTFSGNANAYAACVDNKDGPLSGLMAWGCQAQKNLADAADSTVKTLTPSIPGTPLDNSRKSGGTIFKPGTNTSFGFGSGGGGGGTSASKNCQGCSAGNIGCEIGKLSCEFTKTLGDATNSTFDVFGKYMPYFLAGGAIVIAVLLIKR